MPSNLNKIQAYNVTNDLKRKIKMIEQKLVTIVSTVKNEMAAGGKNEMAAGGKKIFGKNEMVMVMIFGLVSKMWQK